MSRNRFLALAVLAASLGVSGCFSLFPKSEPATLYRFGMPAAAEGAAEAPRATEVIKGPIGFNRAAATDRILTVTGQEAAYIAASRWVAPAPSLFEEAVERAFAASPSAPRLTEVGAMSRGGPTLRLDVDTFEARYEQGPETPPTVVVAFRASLIGDRDRALLGERVFEARRPASENRVGAIAAAFDAAVTDTVGQLVQWTTATAR